MSPSLAELIKEAKTFGSAACQEGIHTWASEGGRPCPKEYRENCGQTVYRCTGCGAYDYGDPGGPGHSDCNSGQCPGPYDG
jgi:hypothetical protein